MMRHIASQEGITLRTKVATGQGTESMNREENRRRETTPATAG